MYKRRSIFQLITAFLCFTLALTNDDKCPSTYQQNNFVLRNNILMSSMAENQQDCTRKCTSYIGCFSVNYFKKKKMCELNKATHLSSPVDLAYNVEGTYIGLINSPTFCSNKYCSNDQICLVNRHASQEYICQGPEVQDICSDKYCKIGHICLVNKTRKEYICQGCSSALGMKSGKIPNSAITASSYYSNLDAYAPYRGRLNNYPVMPYNTDIDSASWSAASNQAGEYLQINLGAMTYVTKVATQGRAFNITQYVTKYKLAYETNNNTFVEYHENDRVKLFPGNRNSNKAVIRRLPEKIKTQFIRFVVVEWAGHISMRVDVYGCPVD